MGRRGYYYLLMYRVQRELLVYFRFYFAIPHKIEKKNLEKDEMNIACANKWMMRNHGKRKVRFLFSTCFTSPPPKLKPWMPTQKYTTKSTTTTTPPGDAFSIHPQSIPLRVTFHVRPCSIRTYRPYTWGCRCWRQNSGNGMFVNGVAICDVIWWSAGLSISELWVRILRRI